MARNNALEEVKIALQWYDSRVNGSLSALVAVAFGVFGILRLYNTKFSIDQVLMRQVTWNWILLTISYILIGFLGLYFFLRMVGYSTMANRGGEKLLPNGGTGRVGRDLKKDIRTAKDLSRFQKFCLHAINSKWYSVALIILIYVISWLGAAIQF